MISAGLLTRSRTRRRAWEWLTFLLIAILAAAAPAEARRVGSEAVKAARYLGAWRYEEARAVIEGLRKAAPDAPETRWLLGELAFLDGDYPAALAAIDG